MAMVQTLAVNWNNLGMGLFIVWFLVVCVLMMLTVLIQKPQGGGLAGAFGSGAGSGQTAFGAKTGDALTWATIIMFIVWLLTAVLLNLAFQPATAREPAAIVAPGAPEGGAAPATPAGGEGLIPIQVEPQPVPPAEGTPEPAPGVAEPGETPPDAAEPAPEPDPTPAAEPIP